jgi:hypothetical protein
MTDFNLTEDDDSFKLVLPCGRVAWIDYADAALVLPFNLFAGFRGNGLIYVECRARAPEKKRIMLHKLLTGWDRTDHKDGDGLNNRRSNLRPCTHAQNMRNGKKRTTRPFKGVFQSASGKWFAQICVDHKRVYGGSFEKPEDAAKKYDELAATHHGEFARLNFPVAHVD